MAGSDDIVIAGVGLVTPLGTSAWGTFTSLLQGKTIASRAARLATESDPRVDTDAPLTPTALARAVGCVACVQGTSVDPAVDLAEMAAREAMAMAGVDPAAPGLEACFLATSKGAMHAFTAAASMHASSPDPAPHHAMGQAVPGRLPREVALSVALGPSGYLAHHLSRRLNVPITRTVVAACASSLIALHQARLTLLSPPPVGPDLSAAGSNRPPRRVLVITSEAALLPMFIHSYKRLGVLPPTQPGTYRGRPLNQQREGFVPTEQAAAVLLELRPPGTSRGTGGTGVAGGAGGERPSGAGPCLHLRATGVAAEAYDLMQSAPAMPALAHVAEALFAHCPVTVLHPHATGTMENDAVELAVYEQAWRATRGAAVGSTAGGVGPGGAGGPVGIYAAKGAVGHGLGAAGLVSLVIACLSARTGRLPPMPWLTQPLDSPLLVGRSERLPAHSSHAIFAAGFGGHVAGAVIDYR